MSQWTHVIGVIRFDSWNANCHPKPPRQAEVLSEEVCRINGIFQTGFVPTGSEGPLHTDTILTQRGPTVVITGDLRDFGINGVAEIIEWLNQCMRMTSDWIMMRDHIIRCVVEFGPTYFIDYDMEKGFFIGETIIEPRNQN